MNYLTPENSGIAYLGTVYPALPKVSNESDLFQFVPPGTGVGVIIYMFIENQEESRVALGGQHGGRKFRHYGLSLLCIMKSDLSSSADGQAAFNEFIDDLTAAIQADRNAGTEAASLGGFGPYVGTGVVWQWGEGSMLGGPDIHIEYPVPKTAEGGVQLFQAVVRVTVAEFLNT
jgi:hypothetical protein